VRHHRRDQQHTDADDNLRIVAPAEVQSESTPRIKQCVCRAILHTESHRYIQSSREDSLTEGGASSPLLDAVTPTFAGSLARDTIAAPTPALTRAMMAALGSSGTASHPGTLEIAHKMTVTMLAAIPPAIAFVAVMTVSSMKSKTKPSSF
jgi:hypothetical protein